MSDLIPETDLEWRYTDPYRDGGQKVSPTVHSIWCRHLPTNITVLLPDQYSLHRGRAVARQMIEAALTSPEWRP